MSVPAVEQLHPHDYQGRVPERLPSHLVRELAVLQPGKALLAIALEWAAILTAIALSETVRNPFVYLAAVIWIGARQHALTVLGHDAAHYRLLPGKHWNDWIGNLFTQWPTFLAVEGFAIITACITASPAPRGTVLCPVSPL